MLRVLMHGLHKNLDLIILIDFSFANFSFNYFFILLLNFIINFLDLLLVIVINYQFNYCEVEVCILLLPPLIINVNYFVSLLYS